MNQKSIYRSPEGQKKIQMYYNDVLKRWPVPCERQFIKTRHGLTHVIVSGEEAAPPLVLLHGAGINSAMWMGDMAVYCRHFRVFALDTPGEPGLSETRRMPYTGSACTEWMEDLFHALDINRAVVTGVSQGGWIALRFAARHPAQVDKLVLVCPGGVTPVRLTFVFKLMGLSLLGDYGRRRIEKAILRGLDLPQEMRRYNDLLKAHYNHRMDMPPVLGDRDLAGLAMPVLLVAGRKDIVYDSRKTAMRLHEQAADFKARLLADAGHALPDTLDCILPFILK